MLQQFSRREDFSPSQEETRIEYLFTLALQPGQNLFTPLDLGEPALHSGKITMCELDTRQRGLHFPHKLMIMR
jgi:hypothetical protein